MKKTIRDLIGEPHAIISDHPQPGYSIVKWSRTSVGLRLHKDVPQNGYVAVREAGIRGGNLHQVGAVFTAILAHLGEEFL